MAALRGQRCGGEKVVKDAGGRRFFFRRRSSEGACYFFFFLRHEKERWGSKGKPARARVGSKGEQWERERLWLWLPSTFSFWSERLERPCMYKKRRPSQWTSLSCLWQMEARISERVNFLNGLTIDLARYPRYLYSYSIRPPFSLTHRFHSRFVKPGISYLECRFPIANFHNLHNSSGRLPTPALASSPKDTDAWDHFEHNDNKRCVYTPDARIDRWLIRNRTYPAMLDCEQYLSVFGLISIPTLQCWCGGKSKRRLRRPPTRFEENPANLIHFKSRYVGSFGKISTSTGSLFGLREFDVFSWILGFLDINIWANWDEEDAVYIGFNVPLT